ncbi:putative hemocytin [Caerostris extrusa]|uniref:Hemocytin n=1 Tax=Caerostris extrusa TaxID=172846 RepID=A0AAV4W4U5_CAEEX|nr:putative hemocytin [Caerostris extrusa]
MDCCNMGAEESCQCTSMGEFVLECSRAGVDMSKGWRQPDYAVSLGCTNGSVYNECGPACPPTCRDLQPVCNFQKCVDGCHCPTGTVLEKGQCISKDLCPCHYGSQHFDSGETIQQDCNAVVVFQLNLRFILGITIHTPEEAVVKLKPSMDVTVNGREMESLPIKAPGIYIGQSTSSFMRVPHLSHSGTNVLAVSTGATGLESNKMTDQSIK